VVQRRRFPLTFPGFTVSQRGRERTAAATVVVVVVVVAARDGNREIALATLIFKSAKLQEARGQIELPAAGHGEPTGRATGGRTIRRTCAIDSRRSISAPALPASR